MNPSIYIFFGPPGVGKGTLAQFCVETYGWAHISTGNMCRKHIALKTDIGNEIAKEIAVGNLIKDELIVSMIKEEMSLAIHKESPVIVDGFPRTYEQAIIFDSLLNSMNISRLNRKIVLFEAADDILLKRSAGRLVCSNQACEKVYSIDAKLQNCISCNALLIHRVDDTNDVMKKRIATYKSHALEVKNFWIAHSYNICQLNTEKPFEKVLYDFRSCFIESN